MGLVTYRGDCSFRQLSLTDGGWKLDVRGTDKLTDRWYGRADDLDAFLAKYPVGMVHSTYKGMFLEGVDNDDGAAMVTVDLNYVGFRTGFPRGPFYTPSFSVGSAQASVTLSSGQATISVQYFAPTGQYEWWELSKPSDTPKYSGVVSTINPLGSIFQSRFTGPGAENGQVSLSDFTAVLNALTQSTFVQDYTPEEIVTGKLWHCKSSTVRSLT